MSRVTPKQERGRDARTDRLRREESRRRRQSATLVAVAAIVLATLGTAFALRPGSPIATAAPAAPTTASVAPVTPLPTREASAAVEASATPSSAEATTPAPAHEATPTPVKAAPKPLKPAPGVKTIVLDKSEQQVTLYKADGTPVDTFRCASGVTYPRVGTYKVYGHRMQSWSLYDDTTFYYFTQFVKSDKGNNIGFHSIPVTPDGQLVGKLGVPVSHGCVRLAKDKAKFVYSWAVTGTRVVVRK